MKKCQTHGSNIGLKCCVASNEGQDRPYIYIYIYIWMRRQDWLCYNSDQIEVRCDTVDWARLQYSNTHWSNWIAKFFLSSFHTRHFLKVAPSALVGKVTTETLTLQPSVVHVAWVPFVTFLLLPFPTFLLTSCFLIRFFFFFFFNQN